MIESVLRRKKMRKTVSVAEGISSAASVLSPDEGSGSRRSAQLLQCSPSADAATELGSGLEALPPPRKGSHLQVLSEVLLGSRMELVGALCSRVLVKEKSTGCNSPLGTLLVKVFSHNGKTQRLLQWCVKQEINSTNNFANLFRGSGVATRLLAVFYKLEAFAFLQHCLKPLLAQIIARCNDLELDATKVGEEAAGAHMRAFVQILDDFFSSVIASASDLPPHFRMLLKYSQCEIEAKFPYQSETVTVGGFFFLRYLCPAIISPEVYGLCDEVPQAARRFLVMVSKTLQWIACGTTADNSQEHHEALSRYVATKSSDVTAFFNKLVDVAIEDGPLASLSSCDPVARAMDATTSLMDIMTTVQSHFGELKEAITRDNPDTAAKIIEQLRKLVGGMETSLLGQGVAAFVSPKPQADAVELSEEEMKKSLATTVDAYTKTWERKLDREQNHVYQLQEEKLCLERLLEDQKKAAKRA
eukprot:TRINITY_DN3420_c0_g1_i4.p1 TRINITY_DN3420_c0_g1~~TRINITY_DN3420_c0_g1_i4.p1  ORF type:complete len:473 (+),score=160.67 TRINITY_DN3420_c0_g1_i4:32-1450(+)